MNLQASQFQLNIFFTVLLKKESQIVLFWISNIFKIPKYHKLYSTTDLTDANLML